MRFWWNIMILQNSFIAILTHWVQVILIVFLSLHSSSTWLPLGVVTWYTVIVIKSIPSRRNRVDKNIFKVKDTKVSSKDQGYKDRYDIIGKPCGSWHFWLVQTNLVIRNVLSRNKLVLRNHFPWPIVNLLHKNKEHLALRNNFRMTKKFLITKFDCTSLKAKKWSSKIG